MIKVGRYTGAILLLAVGGILIWDQSSGTTHVQYLIDWWPVLFILWGIEYIILNIAYRNSDRRMKLDLGGMFLAVLLSGIVFSVTQPSLMSDVWKQLNFKINFATNFGSDEGMRFEKPLQKVAIDKETEAIVVRNEYGDVVVQSGEVDQLEVSTVMRVDLSDKQEAEQIANESTVNIVPGQRIQIETKGKKYGGNWQKQPRMDLVLTFPERSAIDLDIETMLGDIDIQNATARHELKLVTMKGDIDLENVVGTVRGETFLGEVSLSAIEGEVEMTSKSGDFNVSHITGRTNVATLSGEIRLEEVQGDIVADTKNGDIHIDRADHNVLVSTLNGDIFMDTKVIGGDWDVHSTIGNLDIAVPDTGDYTVEGASGIGSVNVIDLPFQVGDKSLSGTVGNGKFKVKLSSNNELTLKKN